MTFESLQVDVDADIKRNYKCNQYEFCCEFQQKLEEDGMAIHLMLSNKTTFHFSSIGNCYNDHDLHSQNPHIIKHEQDSPEVIVLCHITSQNFWPFLICNQSMGKVTQAC
jgi:hypothetical protein